MLLKREWDYVLRLLETEVECNENPMAKIILSKLKGTSRPVHPVENIGSSFTHPDARPLGELLGPDEIVCSLTEIDDGMGGTYRPGVIPCDRLNPSTSGGTPPLHDAFRII